jgi:aspartate/glutamate racemase
MTQLLEQAVAAARQLPDAEQEAIAALIMAEIEDDRRWEESFARSSDKLKALAARAADQVRTGQCRTAGFDEL